jgi:hypothetical protein
VKAVRENATIPIGKNSSNKGTFFASETMETGREWHNSFLGAFGKKSYPSRILCPVKTSYSNEEESKTFEVKES